MIGPGQKRNAQGMILAESVKISRTTCCGTRQVLLDEVVAEAYPAPDTARDLLLDTPFEKVVRAWREVASPSEAAVSDFLQHYEPPTIAQPPD